jgi:hypothetical protein
MSIEKDASSESVDEKETKAPARTHAAELKAVTHDKESLSVYFTILAAGFGLISDGCKFCL